MSRNATSTLNATPVHRPNFNLQSDLIENSARNVFNSESKKVFTIRSGRIPSLIEHHSPERRLDRMESLARKPHHRKASLKFSGDPDTRTMVTLTKEDDLGLDVNLILINTLRKPIHVSKLPFSPTVTSPFSFYEEDQ